MTPERLAELHAQCFETPRPWSADEFKDLLAQNSTHLIPHQHGFALIMLAGPEAELLTLAVDPAHRRQGIARQLIASLETLCRENRVEDVFLEVVDTNVGAQALYAATGFERRGARKDYYNGPKGTKVSAIIMAKSL